VAALNDRGKAVRGSRVLVLGVAYKPNVDDCRESPAFEIIELLEGRAAIVSYNDPHIPFLPSMRNYAIRMESTPLTPDVLREQDCVLIATDHGAYDYEHILRHAGLVVDSRGATRRCASRGDARIVMA